MTNIETVKELVALGEKADPERWEYRDAGEDNNRKRRIVATHGKGVMQPFKDAPDEAAFVVAAANARPAV
ncbi:MAG: hypothetical protein IIC53_03505, partial [Proteobacteria bacterium]|nr:hypothetical protein [Pseudomonadota bacterium]